MSLPLSLCEKGHPAFLVCYNQNCSTCAFICHQCEGCEENHDHEEDKTSFLLEKSFKKTLEAAAASQVDLGFDEVTYAYHKIVYMLQQSYEDYQRKVKTAISSLRQKGEVERLRQKVEEKRFQNITGSEISHFMAAMKTGGGRYENLEEVKSGIQTEKAQIQKTFERLEEMLIARTATDSPAVYLIKEEFEEVFIESSPQLSIEEIVPVVTARYEPQKHFTAEPQLEEVAPIFTIRHENRPQGRQEISQQASQQAQNFFFEGEKFYQDDLFAEAEEQFKLCLQINPQHHQALYFLGLIQEEVKSNFDKALELYQKSISFNGDSTLAIMLAAGIYYEKGQHDKVKDYALRTLSINPRDSNAYNLLGSVYFAKNDCKRALHYYDRAIQESQKYAIYYTNRAAVHEKMKNMKAAREDKKAARKVEKQTKQL